MTLFPGFFANTILSMNLRSSPCVSRALGWHPARPRTGWRGSVGSARAPRRSWPCAGRPAAAEARCLHRLRLPRASARACVAQRALLVPSPVPWAPTALRTSSPALRAPTSCGKHSRYKHRSAHARGNQTKSEARSEAPIPQQRKLDSGPGSSRIDSRFDSWHGRQQDPERASRGGCRWSRIAKLKRLTPPFLGGDRGITPHTGRVRGMSEFVRRDVKRFGLKDSL